MYREIIFIAEIMTRNAMCNLQEYEVTLYNKMLKAKF